MNIRKEAAGDHAAICDVVKKAFDRAEHADGNEQELVNALRASSAYIPELSLVAEEDGRIIGHIMFTKAAIGGKAILALAPLSVLPEYQRRGVGTALVEEGHRIAKSLGYAYSVVLGSESYYPRFGYVPADTLGIIAPFDVPKENLMVYQMKDDAPTISGMMEYAGEFGVG